MRVPDRRAEPLAPRGVAARRAARRAAGRARPLGARHARPAASCGTARPARRAPRPRVRPTAACSTPCATTRSGCAGGTWWAGCSTAPTTSSPGRPFERERRADAGARGFPTIRPACSARWPGATASRIWSSSGWPIPEPTVRFWNSLVALAPARADRGSARVRAGGAPWCFWLPPTRERVAGHAYAVPSPRETDPVEVLNGTRRRASPATPPGCSASAGLDVVFFGTRMRRRIPPGSSCAGAIRGRDRMWRRRWARGGCGRSRTRSGGWT